MRLIISDISEGGLERKFDLPISISKNSPPDIAGVFIKILKIDKIVLVEGSVNISTSLNCSRCLKDFSYPMEISFREEYRQAEEPEKEEEQELSSRELDLSCYSNDEIDISELIMEQVFLSVPMKPLCGDECCGICPECGKNLNGGPCECKTDEIDPRLAPLKKIKELMKDRKE